MSRDTEVKLFGWTITSVHHDPLSSSSSVLTDSFGLGTESPSSSSSSSSLSLQPLMMDNQTTTDNSKQDYTNCQISSDLNKESKETSENSEITTTTTTTSEEKTTDLKKPDKILPCPRCNSLDTKFCYYNNYNVNQPRHFCRNCQRYWTSGGSMRTVPVGSGRRKNKGWVSSDSMHITSDNYNNSSTKILSFESSKNTHHQSSNTKTNADSVSQGFLSPQVTSSVSPPWPYQYPPNPNFYWGFAVPVWSTQETSTCLGKRTRHEDSHESARESKDSFVRARLDPQAQPESINNGASLTTKNLLWYQAPLKTEKVSFFMNGNETKNSNSNMSFVPETYLKLQANPAAMARSMNFRESM